MLLRVTVYGISSGRWLESKNDRTIGQAVLVVAVVDMLAW